VAKRQEQKQEQMEPVIVKHRYKARRGVECPFVITPGLSDLEDIPCPHFLGEGMIKLLAERANLEPSQFIDIVYSKGDAWRMTGISEEDRDILVEYLKRQAELLQVVVFMKQHFRITFDMTPDYGNGDDAYV